MSIRKNIKMFLPDFIKYKIIKKGGYGYEADKPIQLKSIENILGIIRKLRIDSVQESKCELCDLDKVEAYYSNKFSGFIYHFELLFQVQRIRNKVLELYDFYFLSEPPRNTERFLYERIGLCDSIDALQLPEGFVLKEEINNDPMNYGLSII